MANVAFPGDPLYNPAAYARGEVSAELQKAAGKKTKKSPPVKRFSSLFNKAAGEAGLRRVKELPLSEESLHELLDKVHDSGDALSKRPFPPEIKAYKEAVRDFVHYVVENTFDTREQASGVNILKRKKYTQVAVIDKKLEEIAAAVLRGQAGQLEILAKLDEIKGLLIDLLQ